MSFSIPRYQKKALVIVIYYFNVTLLMNESYFIDAFLSIKSPFTVYNNYIGPPSIHNNYASRDYISNELPISFLVDKTIRHITKPLYCEHSRGKTQHLGSKRDFHKSRKQFSLYAAGSSSSEIKIGKNHESIEPSNEILSILHNNKFGNRIFTIETADFMKNNSFIAEVHLNGKSQLCLLASFKSPSSDKVLQPLVNIILLETETDYKNSSFKTMTVDMGQITTVWKHTRKTTNDFSHAHVLVHLQSVLKDAKKSFELDFPPNHVEVSMQKLYNSYVGRARGYGSMTKKQISKIASEAKNEAFVENILRKAVKAGDGMSRLVDSSIAMDYFYSDYPSDSEEELIRRFVCAEVLSLDSILGGRFKRMSLIFLDAEYITSKTNNEEKLVKTLTFLNGGWIVQDLSLRAGAEARKFAERSLGAISDAKNVPGKPKKRVYALTEADERIMKRLECLAMGENLDKVYKGSKRGTNSEDKTDQELELDLRESLLAMNLPVSPEGAQQALIQLGCWSEKNPRKQNETGKSKLAIEPWSSEILEAANKYSIFAKRTREKIQSQCNLGINNKNHSKKADKNLEGRIDLTHLPSVCVDAERATFRDDAIGVRPRSSTGRKVIKAASKWEILIHIADVSDIYNEYGKRELLNKEFDPLPLREAAESRGTSRYDLPLGPLHLMPPVALDALALVTEKPSNKQNHRINRCVTLWAYIDERNGKLIDAGLERTLISSPIALSFSSASTLLESNNSAISNPRLKQAKVLLSVAERNIIRWSKNRVSSDKSAKLREERLAVKEMIAQQTFSIDDSRDDGYNGSFQRTRGHLLVDAMLDLHGYALSGLFWRAKAPIPRAAGSGANRGGRLGTAPLRRYIDGVTQRQALSVFCGYGGAPMTKEECKNVSKIATKAMNNNSNFRSKKDGTKTNGGNKFVSNQRDALSTLKRHLVLIKSKSGIVPAITTGRQNEVIILGVGAIGKCIGQRQQLRKGNKVSVKVVDLDPEKGILNVSLIMDKD